MAVTSEVSQSVYVGNGATTSFATGFRFLTNSDVVVSVQPDGGSAVTQTLGVNYTLAGVGLDVGGTVTFIAAPASASTITITRDSNFTQLTSFRTQGSFSPILHETALDAAAMRDQELERRLIDIETVVDASVTLVEAGLPLWPDAPLEAVSAAGYAKVRLSGTSLGASIKGGTYRDFVPHKGHYTATEIGVLVTNTASQNSDAIEAWLAIIDNRGGNILQFDQSTGGSTYSFARTIILDKAVWLRGAGPMGRSMYGTYITFPANTDGIWIRSYIASPPYNRGDASRIEELQIVGLGYGGATSGHGVFMEGRGSIINCQIQNFGSHGVAIEGRSGDGTNANLWYMERVTSSSNHGSGFYVDGADSNAGVAMLCDGSSNDRYGFEDSSFLGNTYVGCHTDANILGSYLCDDVNARSMFLGCYVEGGQALPDLGASRSTWLGGLSEGGLASGLGLVDARWSYMAVSAKGGANTGIWNYLQFGSNASEGEQAYIRLWHEQWAGSQVTMRYASADRFFEWYSPDGITGLRIAGALGAARDGRAIYGATHIFPTEFFLGDRKIATGSSVPTSGTWMIGDRVLNPSIVAGGAEGWVCTASGTQGTYDHARTATATGTTTITFSGTEGRLRVGDYITVGATAVRIVSINTTTYLTMVVSATVGAGSGLAIDYVAATFAEFGRIIGNAADSTASPGDATQNALSGRVAIAAGASSVTVTNSKCTATSRPFPVLQTIDATLTQLLACVPAAGSFTIYGNANATAAVNVGWELR